MSVLVAVLSLIVVPRALAQASPVQVETQYGPIVGTSTDTNNLFKGVPYAAAPVGDLRWKPPQPPQPWTTPRDATGYSPICMQPTVGPGKRVNMSEDCLSLNVYTPAGAAPGANLPVMLWIHPGGWFIGDGNQYDASELASRNGVIVVTFNYRLGPLGYLALPGFANENPHHSSGNYGMQDQQQAMRWVRDNIANFGGNQNNVTLFGQSAGSGSICAHLVSPQAAGLFHRAIMQSFACAQPMTSLSAAVSATRSINFANDPKLRCAELDQARVVSCMRSKSAEEVIDAFAPEVNAHGEGVLAFGKYMAIQADDGYYLPRSPREAFATGQFNKVPILSGTTKSEGNTVTMLDFELAGKPLTPGNNFDAVNSEVVRKFMWPGLSEIATTLLTTAYSPSRFPAPAGSDPVEAPALLANGAWLTDYVFACNAATTNDLAAAHQVPTWGYEFSDPNAEFYLKNTKFPLGAGHATDLAYVFGRQNQRGPNQTPVYGGMTPEQVTLSQQMQQYWTNFARNGDPNGPGLPAWPRLAPLNGKYLDLAPNAVMAKDTLAFRADHHCLEWEPLIAYAPVVLSLTMAFPF
ncbi:carboxylesterase/lipase family protein [Nocardia salmonicida]|uniref:carboxylesterase/lipase family protein n=1 Tax=Nocardia salmonicida TaxID=53431 RepID=UPI003792F163